MAMSLHAQHPRNSKGVVDINPSENEAIIPIVIPSAMQAAAAALLSSHADVVGQNTIHRWRDDYG